MTPSSVLLDPRRFVMLDGVSNFRDIGGYVANRGKTVRWRSIFRSGHCDNASCQDVQRLAEIGIGLRFDLRNQGERRSQPANLTNCEVHCLADKGAATDHETVAAIEQALTGTRDFPGEDFWIAAYGRLVETARPMLAELLTRIAEADQPAIVHCVSGKDRTGLAIALLLDLLGVDRETIRFDFLLTNLLQAPARVSGLRDRLKLLGKSPEDVLGTFSVSQASLDEAFRLVEENYGGTLAYLRSGGMPVGVSETLKAKFLM